MMKEPRTKSPISTAQADQYYFFYSTSSPFSNFHPAHFVDEEEGNSFFCSEQYMMYHKAILFEDYNIAEKILEGEIDPMICKRLGRQVKNFNHQVWKANARRIVADGLYLKFTQNPFLKRELLSTSNLEMIEAAPRDRIWGIGYSAKKALEIPITSWGTNWLGQALMIVRERIRKEEYDQEEAPNEEG
eukprot:CAMPEP_0201869580 /NCGR_PEP_ID=MMETSP0902-20130614/3046_1 /ASSEMBLY_ACC=CAM_ASM_000551 /TAXON_ID=420261 /ORGANISM="Thalassiosira antarctica, Strain CCMP982" /LENGTH=187 /DNA_ID=CAMNT_0048395111 /DNA_START=121 /DNA_END=684 /DNA_ORIENTATION=+